MHIVVVGLNHQSAPIEVREQASFTGPAITAANEELRRQDGVHEVIVLSTCNRTEIYVVSVCPIAGETAARSLLQHAGSYLYVHRDREAIEHLFRVASGLDSLVLGESEILGQVRRAADLARDAKTSGRVLATLFQQATHAGRRARSETKIGHHTLSTAAGAVALARGHVDDLRGKTVLLIGTGVIAGQTVDALRSADIAELVVASRTVGRAQQRVEEWASRVPSLKAVSFDELATAAAQADIIFAASTCSTPILGAPMLDSRSKPLVVVDLGVPRNVDPDVASIPGVLHFDLDDLNQVVETNLAERRREVGPVTSIVAAETDGFETWLRTLGVQPVITTLHSRAEQIRIQEVERALRRMVDLSPSEREKIETLTQAIVTKILHEPTIRLRAHASEGRGYQFAEAIRDLFDLEQTP